MERAVDIDALGTIPEQSLGNFAYIVGSARGGTTIFKNAFSVHERIMTFPGMTHFMNQVWRYRDTVHMRLLSQIFSLPDFYNPRALARELDDARARALPAVLARNLESGNLARMWSNYALAWGLDPKFGKDPRAISLWMDKANDCGGLETIRKAFPKGRFLFIFRDPRASVLSLSQRMATKGGRDKAGFGTNEIVRSCIYWRNMAQRMLRFMARHPEHSLPLRFEDFLLEPEKTMNRAFAFLGLPLVPEAELGARLAGMHYGASNSPEQDSGISSKPLERWKTGLTGEQQHLVSALTGVTARKAGYGLEQAEGRATRLAQALGVQGLGGKGMALAKALYLEVREPLAREISR